MLSFDKESQGRIFEIAAERAQGKPIKEGDERVVHALDAHPEFDDIWTQGELAAHPQEVNGTVVNPFVHIVFHVIVDRQVSDEDPDFVAETHNRLTGQGMNEHDSLHAVIQVYADIYFANFRKGREFDHLEYQTRLNMLSYEDA